MTRFWLLELAGRKLVRLMPPSENWRDPAEDPRFQKTLYKVDLMEPDFVAYPHLDGALVYEAILEPGDVLFIPEGWAHQALNLDWTLMISANYRDQHAFQSITDADRHENVCFFHSPHEVVRLGVGGFGVAVAYTYILAQAQLFLWVWSSSSMLHIW
jgi:hypothetical protein